MTRRLAFRRRRTGALLLAGLLVLAVVLRGGTAGLQAASGCGERAARIRIASAPPRRSRTRRSSKRNAVAAVLAYTPFVKEGGERGRDIALTFDDGPGPYTPGS